MVEGTVENYSMFREGEGSGSRSFSGRSGSERKLNELLLCSNVTLIRCLRVVLHGFCLVLRNSNAIDIVVTKIVLHRCIARLLCRLFDFAQLSVRRRCILLATIITSKVIPKLNSHHLLKLA